MEALTGREIKTPADAIEEIQLFQKAGIAVGLARDYKIKEILKFASACGTANALEKESGFVNLSTVNTLKQLVQVRDL